MRLFVIFMIVSVLSLAGRSIAWPHKNTKVSGSNIFKTGQSNCLQPHIYLLASFKADYCSEEATGEREKFVLSVDGLY